MPPEVESINYALKAIQIFVNLFAYFLPALGVLAGAKMLMDWVFDILFIRSKQS